MSIQPVTRVLLPRRPLRPLGWVHIQWSADALRQTLFAVPAVIAAALRGATPEPPVS